jgi:hypothetical protein
MFWCKRSCGAEMLRASRKVTPDGVPGARVNRGLCDNRWAACRCEQRQLCCGLQVLNSNLSPKEAVFEIMNLPQIEER